MSWKQKYTFNRGVIEKNYQKSIKTGIISLTNLNSGTEIGIISQTERQNRINVSIDFDTFL